MAKKETTHVPARQLQVVGATFNELKDKLLENETGWSEEDKALFYKTADGDVLPVGGGRLDIPTTTSLLMGFEEDAETYTYDWKSLESFEPVQGDPLKLWSHLAGVGFFAEVARRDIKGRDISENLDYASVLIALYDVTTYAEIDSAISSRKSVILSIGQYAKFAYLHSKINSGYVFRSILSEDHTYVDYTVSSNNTWSSNTYDIGESNPTQGSNKLFTSGGAFTALAKKANATNLTPGTFTKLTVNEQGVATRGSQLDGNDIPEHSADKLTSGHIDPNRLRDSSIPAAKLEIRKKLMVDGETITATETEDSVVLHSADDLARGDIGLYDSTQDIHKIIAGRPGNARSVVIHIDRDNSNAGKLVVRFDGALNSWAVGATELCMICNARARECLTTDSGGSDTFKQTAGTLSGSVTAATSYSHSLVLYASDQIPTTYGVTMEISVSFLKDSVRYYARFDCAIYNVGAQDSKNEVFMGHGDIWQVS